MLEDHAKRNHARLSRLRHSRVVRSNQKRKAASRFVKLFALTEQRSSVGVWLSREVRRTSTCLPVNPRCSLRISCRTPVFPLSRDVTARLTDEYGMQPGDWINYDSIISNGAVSRYTALLLIARYVTHGCGLIPLITNTHRRIGILTVALSSRRLVSGVP